MRTLLRSPSRSIREASLESHVRERSLTFRLRLVPRRAACIAMSSVARTCKKRCTIASTLVTRLRGTWAETSREASERSPFQGDQQAMNVVIPIVVDLTDEQASELLRLPQ